MKTRTTKKKIKKLTDQQKEQNVQMREIRNLMNNIGFKRISYVDGREFTYEQRVSELDDIFYYENVILLSEYTISKAPWEHLEGKKIIYDLINENPIKFFKYLINLDNFKSIKEIVDKEIQNKYSLKELQVRIVYASKNTVTQEHKNLVHGVYFLDFSVVKYFESLSKVIKKSTRFEFVEFLNIEYSKFAENIKETRMESSDSFSGHILPEEHSSFKEGYKLVSFYIDAESLIRRSYVLRKDGWRNKDNIGLYQRLFQPKKIKSMRKYLHEEKRVFVNNIIATLSTENVELFDESNKLIKIDDEGNFLDYNDTKVTPAIIKIENKYNIIGIVDGQHRIYSYHEGDDSYEKSISKLRTIQNLLVTGILYPRNESEERRIKFEAGLFLEINSNQTGAASTLKQEIELILKPLSLVAVSKYIIFKLNESGPLGALIEEHWYDKSKIKTASIISFGLKPLIKFEETDSLFKLWTNPDKAKIKRKEEDSVLLNEYKNFCVDKIRDIFIGLKYNIESKNWNVSRSNKNSILNVTTVNGVINCLRILVENNKVGNVEFYKNKFNGANAFPFKSYKSSQYRKLGRDLYDQYFKT